MNATKRKRLEAAGFAVGSASDFLGLSPQEEAIVDIRLALGAALKRQRQLADFSQSTLAQRLQSSQSRVAKMEAGDASVSVELLIRGLLEAGATRIEVGAILAESCSQQAQPMFTKQIYYPLSHSRTPQYNINREAIFRGPRVATGAYAPTPSKRANRDPLGMAV